MQALSIKRLTAILMNGGTRRRPVALIFEHGVFNITRGQVRALTHSHCPAEAESKLRAIVADAPSRRRRSTTPETRT